MVIMLDSIVLLLLSIFCVSFVMGHGVSSGLLGELHWCNTLCLCHNETQEMMHCFTDTEIFSLMNLDERKVQRLQSVQFRIDEKLTWCNEVCLCHKNGRKEFKCTNNQSLGEFIRTKTPKLAHYLVPDEEVEIDDLRGHVMEREEDQEHSSEIHNEKKKSKKHRKNKKKKHHERNEEQIEVDTSSTTTTEVAHEEVQGSTTEAQPFHQANNPDPAIHGGHFHDHQQNAIVLQASTGSELASNSFPKYPASSPPLVEVPLERKTVSGEVTKDLAELRENVDHIKADVAMNQHILLVTVAVASVAIIGVVILAIYSCCIRRSTTKHTITKPSRNHCVTKQQQEDNTQTKVNLEEAW